VDKRGRLIALVAAAAVAAVATGGALAYRQGPEDGRTTAAPLQLASSPAPTPAPASKTPTPSSTPSGPTTVQLNVGKLPTGRTPQIPYLVGREVRGGPGQPIQIPGSGGILDFARLTTDVLAIVLTDQSSNLLQLDYSDVRQRIPGVTSLVASADNTAAAYAVGTPSWRGGMTKGGVVYAQESMDPEARRLNLPSSWQVEVLAYREGTVYFRAAESEKGALKLYEWKPGAAKASLVKTVGHPTAIAKDGTVAASMSLLTDGGSCSTVIAIATGRQLWRTCENQLSGFTPDGRTVVGTPSNGEGYCSDAIAALDATTGNLLREWKGCFQDAVPEDDQHLLIVAVVSGGGGDPGTKSAIIRCDVTTGGCERATPITVDQALSLQR
jgi:hypothetical protein